MARTQPRGASPLWDEGYFQRDVLVVAGDVVSSAEKRSRFVRFWEAVAEGQDPTSEEFEKRLT